MGEAEETEKEIEARSNEYRPVAKRASLLYFCLADLAVVSLMGPAGQGQPPVNAMSRHRTGYDKRNIHTRRYPLWYLGRRDY